MALTWRPQRPERLGIRPLLTEDLESGTEVLRTAYGIWYHSFKLQLVTTKNFSDTQSQESKLPDIYPIQYLIWNVFTWSYKVRLPCFASVNFNGRKWARTGVARSKISCSWVPEFIQSIRQALGSLTLDRRCRCYRHCIMQYSFWTTTDYTTSCNFWSQI